MNSRARMSPQVSATRGCTLFAKVLAVTEATAPCAENDTAADGRPLFLTGWSQPAKAPAAASPMANTRAAATTTAKRPPREGSAGISDRRRDEQDPAGAEEQSERQPPDHVTEVVHAQVDAAETQHQSQHGQRRNRRRVQRPCRDRADHGHARVRGWERLAERQRDLLGLGGVVDGRSRPGDEAFDDETEG